MSAFVLLANANVDSSQCIAILAAAAPNDKSLSSKSSLDDFVRSVKYESIATVLRQCDRDSASPSINSHSATPSYPAQQFPANNHNSNSRSSNSQLDSHRSNRSNKNRNHWTKDKIAKAKASSKCSLCGKFGHWYADHDENGQLKPGHASNETPIANHDTPESTKKPTVTFNTSSLVSASSPSVNPSASALSVSSTNDDIGPLLDCGAPYSAIGIVELQSLAPSMINQVSFSLEVLPPLIADRPFLQYGIGSHAQNHENYLDLLFCMRRLKMDLSLVSNISLLKGRLCGLSDKMLQFRAR